MAELERLRAVVVREVGASDDPKSHDVTLETLGALLGVSRETIRDWLAPDGNNGESANASQVDSRVKVPPDQRKELRKQQKKIAAELKSEGMTQEAIGALLGVSRQTIQVWLDEDGNIANGGNPSQVDSRVKVPPDQRPILVEQVASGVSREQVAADAGITVRRVNQIVTVETKQAKAKQDREEAVQAFRLSRLGWTQAEIGEMLGVTGQRIGQDLKVFQDLGELSNSQLADGHPVEEVARRQGVWEVCQFDKPFRGQRRNPLPDQRVDQMQPNQYRPNAVSCEIDALQATISLSDVPEDHGGGDHGLSGLYARGSGGHGMFFVSSLAGKVRVGKGLG